MTAWRFYEKVSMHANRKDKEEETSVYLPLPAPMDFYREQRNLSSGVRLIEISRCLFSLCREASTCFLTCYFQSPILPFVSPTFLSINLDRNEIVSATSSSQFDHRLRSSRIESKKDFLPVGTNQTRTQRH